MKLVFTLALCLACAGVANAQKTEVAIQLNSSASWFGGNAAEKSTYIDVSDTSPHKMLGNPYGTDAAIGYGLNLQLQRVTNYNLLLGMQLGTEQLRSEVGINRITGFRQTAEATGEATLKLNAITAQPYFGWRLTTKLVDLDLTAGVDASYIIKSKYKGEATDADGNNISIYREQSKKELDFRPRVGVTAYKNKLGLSISYAHGLTNYRADWDGSNLELYSRVFRLGLLYRL
ncbi:outer membrane beta-barrel protein [Pontibacter sp. H259]|uniref:outer membrane beta-barrel protein n=1 Tax=Pontibacter sp. H259 TaxID=3133421 RepID=UPI0030BFBF89